jgi:signal peptidase II
LVVLLDQFSKVYIKQYWDVNNLLPFDHINIIGDYLRFVFVENPGIAFGIRVGSFNILIALFSFLAAVFIGRYLYIAGKKFNLNTIGFSLILGGAIGNLIDRVLCFVPNSGYNGVVDFIDIGIGTHRWYIFNVADSAVSIGIALYFAHSYFYSKTVN